MKAAKSGPFWVSSFGFRLSSEPFDPSTFERYFSTHTREMPNVVALMRPSASVTKPFTLS